MNFDLTAIILILVGIGLAFYGYKAQKLLIIIGCFFFGFTLAGQILPHFIADEKVLILVKALVGLFLALAGLKLEKLAIFLGVAYLVYMSIGAYITGIDPSIKLMIQAGIALIVGALSTLFVKYIIIIVSGIAGAALVQQYLPALFSIPIGILTIITVIIAAAGIYYQFKTN
jgi:hypothetical protein